jgi:hypothetical protein
MHILGQFLSSSFEDHTTFRNLALFPSSGEQPNELRQLENAISVPGDKINSFPVALTDNVAHLMTEAVSFRNVERF